MSEKNIPVEWTIKELKEKIDERSKIIELATAGKVALEELLATIMIFAETEQKGE